MKQVQKLVTSIIGATLLFASCSTGNITPDKKIFYMAVDKTLGTLDPIVTNQIAEQEQINQMMEGLTRLGKTQEIELAGAESVDISADKMTYTFNLQKAAVWTNGESVTAHDYEYAWQQLATNPLTGFQRSMDVFVNGTEVRNGEKPATELGATAIDDFTFEVKTTRPYEPLLSLLSTTAFFPVHQETYETLGPEGYGQSIETIMTNGPFTLVKYEPDSILEYIKSETYWDRDNVQLDGAEVRVISELTTQGTMFNAGEIDVLRVTGTLVDSYDEENTISQVEQRQMYIYFSSFEGKENKLFANKNFRQALAHAIDKSILTKNIVKDGAQPLEGIITNGFMKVNGQDFREIVNANNEPVFNVEKAQEYLEAAKKELGADISLTFDFYYQELDLHNKVFENVKNQIETNLPSVTMNIISKPNQIYFPEHVANAENAAMVTWSASYADPESFMTLFEYGSTYNTYKYNNPEFEAKITEAKLETDALKQVLLYGEAESILIEDAVYIPLYQLGMKFRVQEGIEIAVNPFTPVINFKYVAKK
jgi:ABC-type oligopeptide transport system, periplasmic component